MKQFSQQAGVDVVFATRVTDGVRTEAVKGDYVPLDALNQMLSGTPLVARPDDRTGAIMVSRGRAPDPKGWRAALTTASDHPGSQNRPKTSITTPRT